MASTKANHIITNFTYNDINGKESLADIIIAENLDIVVISPLNRENIYSVEEFNSIVKVANLLLKDFKIHPGKAMFFVRTNQFSFRFIEDYISHNMGEERIFQMIFNNLGKQDDSFIEFAELTLKETDELYSLLENEGACYYRPAAKLCSSLCKELSSGHNDHLFIETEDHIECRKLRKEIVPSAILPENFYRIFIHYKGEKIVPSIKSNNGINITLKEYENTSLFHINFLTAVQALQIMKNLRRIFPLVVNDPLVYHWLKAQKCSTKDLQIDANLKAKLKQAEKWISVQTDLPPIILNYY